jgi:Skp family chaperone for outer membrane proteins
MKYFVKFVVVTLFLIASTQVNAEQKIVVLDLKYVLNNSKAGKGAQDFLKNKFNDNSKKFADMEKKLKKEESDLLSKKNALDKEEYKKETNKLRKKVIDYQANRRSSLDKLSKQRKDSREILIKKLEPILDSYINENNISLVMDKKSMIGGSTKFDITSIIVDKLDKEFPSLKIE